jgi:hypothetical protein
MYPHVIPRRRFIAYQEKSGNSVRLWREAGAEPVPVAPSYAKFVNEHMFPTSGADVSAACAVDGVCGSATAGGLLRLENGGHMAKAWCLLIHVEASLSLSGGY